MRRMFRRRTRGLRESTLERYTLYVRRFLRATLGDDPIDPGRLTPPMVLTFIAETAPRFQSRTVGLMTTALGVHPGDRVLEIGTGSGYQAAVLAQLGARVISLEIVPELAAEAKSRLAELKYDAVEVRAGDGYRGWPQRAPFRAIILAAAAPLYADDICAEIAQQRRAVGTCDVATEIEHTNVIQ